MQAFVKTLPGVVTTEAERSNGTTGSLEAPTTIHRTRGGNRSGGGGATMTAGGMGYPFEIINPYSVNRQGTDVYSENPSHLREVEAYIWARPDRDRIHVEVLSLTRYIPSAEKHQNHLDKLPNDYCHIPRAHIKKHLQKQPRNGSLREMLNACKTARLKPHPGIDSRKHQLPPIKASQKVAKNQ